ncbi:hypothetical protein [Vulcanisaeta souniana]|nr:hypothetical protein [Vulcanisaeta souniana]
MPRGYWARSWFQRLRVFSLAFNSLSMTRPRLGIPEALSLRINSLFT